MKKANTICFAGSMLLILFLIITDFLPSFHVAKTQNGVRVVVSSIVDCIASNNMPLRKMRLTAQDILSGERIGYSIKTCSIPRGDILNLGIKSIPPKKSQQGIGCVIAERQWGHRVQEREAGKHIGLYLAKRDFFNGDQLIVGCWVISLTNNNRLLRTDSFEVVSE